MSGASSAAKELPREQACGHQQRTAHPDLDVASSANSFRVHFCAGTDSQPAYRATLVSLASSTSKRRISVIGFELVSVKLHETIEMTETGSNAIWSASQRGVSGSVSPHV
jgi:hypothetical protein